MAAGGAAAAAAAADLLGELALAKSGNVLISTLVPALSCCIAALRFCGE